MLSNVICFLGVSTVFGILVLIGYTVCKAICEGGDDIE